MIKINLLGKKKVSAGAIPFGLDEKLAAMGVSVDDLYELRPGLTKAAVLLVGLYLADFVPTYLHDQKAAELDAQVATLNEKAQGLERELASKKDIRKQMEQINKDELDLQRQLSAVNALQRDRSLAFRTLDQIVTSLPSKVWLTKIIYNSSKRVDLDGRAWEYFPVSDFVKTITESTQFTDVNFKGIATQPNKITDYKGVPDQMQKLKEFSVEFTVKGSGES